MALVQSGATDTAGSGGSLVITLAQALTPGNYITVWALGVGGVVTPTGSDNGASGGNVYTLQQSDQSGVFVSPCCMFTAPVTKSATTITITGCVKTTGFYAEESGVSAVDLSNIAANQGSTSTPTTSVTTSQSHVVAYSMVCYGNGTRTFTQNSGIALPTGNGITTGQHDNATAGSSMFLQRAVVSGAGLINGTVNSSPSVNGADSIILTLIQSALSTATVAWLT